MSCGIGPDENPPLRIAYRTQFTVSWRWSKFGPSLYSRVRTLVEEPWVPAALSVWHPEQRSTNSLAAASWSAETEMFSSPHAATPPAVAARSVAISSARRGLVIGCDSIGDTHAAWTRHPAPPRRAARLRKRRRASQDQRQALHGDARRVHGPPTGPARPEGAAAHGDGHEPGPARPHVPDPPPDARARRAHDDPPGAVEVGVLPAARRGLHHVLRPGQPRGARRLREADRRMRPVEPERFRDVMGHFATGVTVVTAS